MQVCISTDSGFLYDNIILRSGSRQLNKLLRGYRRGFDTIFLTEC